MSKNLSCVLYGIKDLRLEEREVPEPKPGELLIKVHTVGVCGTDIHYWKCGEIGPFKPGKPMILGHETSGTVAGLGKDVKGFAVGDRVAIEPGVACRKCEFCKQGRYHLCCVKAFFGMPPTDGTLRRYLTIDADYCFKIPDSMSMEDAALLEPLSVGLYACRKANIGMGQKVLILGAGPVGQMSLLVSKATGATKAYLTDILDHRLAIGKEVGADEVFNVKGLSPEEAAKIIVDKCGGAPDIAIECCGFQPSIELAIKAVKVGGRVVLVAMGDERVEIPVLEVVAKEIELCGVLTYCNTWPTAIEMVTSGKVKLDKLTRKHYKLEEAVEAYEYSHKSEVIKVFIDCDS